MRRRQVSPNTRHQAVLPMLAAIGLLCVSCRSSSTAPTATSSPPSAATSSSTTAIPPATTTDRLWPDDASYEMEYSVYCGENTMFTDGLVRVAVDNGKATVVSGTAPMEVVTVERLLGIIDEAKHANADKVDVIYDERGVPVHISIDYSASAIDDEFCARITELSFD